MQRVALLLDALGGCFGASEGAFVDEGGGEARVARLRVEKDVQNPRTYRPHSARAALVRRQELLPAYQAILQGSPACIELLAGRGARRIDTTHGKSARD
jgi:hypothetical protein